MSRTGQILQGFKHRSLAGAELYLGQVMDETAQPVGQRSRSARLGAGGGSAIVIALAARSVPKYLQQRAIIWGTVGAIAVRSWLTMVVVWLLQVPGWMLLWRRDFGVDRPPPAGACRR